MARVAATIAVAAMTLSGNAAARDLQQVLNTGTLRVGVTLFAPWAARGTDGELVGFEVDVARQLAADMGVKAQLLSYDVDRLVPALEAGEIDVIAAGLTITPERALHVNFSNPYAESGIGLATHVERTASVTDVKALDSDTITIAAVEGSVGAQLARRLWPRARVQVLRERFGEAVGERLHHDRVIVVVVALEGGSQIGRPDAGRYGKRADVVDVAAFARRDEIGE